MPFPISYLARKVADKISQAYSSGEVKNQFDFVEGEISKNNGYLVDGKLSGADILMSFPLQMAFERKFAAPEDYPAISKWLKTITSEES
ncbi:bifunctional glutathione transferase/peroxidase, partial [Fusarium falciforme]